MKIEKIIAAFCAGITIQTAMALPPEQDASTKAEVARSNLHEAFEKASSQTAPSHSLYIKDAEHLARTLFTTADIVIFGEIHHSTNYKFLADNPSFFQEAAMRGAKNVYIELPVTWKSVTDAYFSHEIQDDIFESEIRGRFSDIALTAGSPADDYATQFLALCRVARQAGLKIMPTDFRIMNAAPGTSDIVGIPDILRRDDAVLAHTRVVMRQYEEETGLKHPVTVKDFYRFNMLYFTMLEKLSPEQQHDYGEAQSVRQQIWLDEDRSDNHTAFQNELQARYSGTIDKPGDKILFIGGSRHIVGRKSIGDLAHRSNHTRVIAIELLSQSGLLWRSGIEPPEIRSLYLSSKAFSYRIETENAKIIPLSRSPG